MLKTNRKSEYPIHELILNRWSARAFSNQPISEQELMTIFDAARWAQNSFNNQPWRFIYTRRESKHWPTFFDLLEKGNQIWVKNAQVLVLVISKKTFDYDDRPSITHGFDTGAAAQNMSLQAAFLNIICHGMEGFDYQKAREAFVIPQDYEVMAMFAMGKLGNKESLPEKLQKAETPNSRKPLKEVVFEDEFKLF